MNAQPHRGALVSRLPRFCGQTFHRGQGQGARVLLREGLQRWMSMSGAADRGGASFPPPFIPEVDARWPPRGAAQLHNAACARFFSEIPPFLGCQRARSVALLGPFSGLTRRRRRSVSTAQRFVVEDAVPSRDARPRRLPRCPHTNATSLWSTSSPAGSSCAFTDLKVAFAGQIGGSRTFWRGPPRPGGGGTTGAGWRGR